jgi:hypothetical protein
MRASTAASNRSTVAVLGCDDVGSAIACILHAAGAAVVLIDDADPPWARRGRSYTDAWYVGGATLERVDACFCGSVRSLPAVLARGDMIAATTWSVQGVATAVQPTVVVETRPGCTMSVSRTRPAFLDSVLTISVRTTQVAGWPADIVIAGPRHAPGTHASARALPPDAQRERIDAPHAGRFRTRHEIAERVEAGDVLGELGVFACVAPIAGVLTALAPRGARVAAGHALAEIDPQGDPVGCFGIEPGARAIAHRVCAAVRTTSRSGMKSPAASCGRDAIPA